MGQIEITEIHSLPMGDIVTVRMSGQFDVKNVRKMEDDLLKIFHRDKVVKGIIFDFMDITALLDTADGLFVKLIDKFVENNVQVRFFGVPERLVALWDMLGLLALFHVEPTKEKALKSINNK